VAANARPDAARARGAMPDDPGIGHLARVLQMSHMAAHRGLFLHMRVAPDAMVRRGRGSRGGRAALQCVKRQRQSQQCGKCEKENPFHPFINPVARQF